MNITLCCSDFRRKSGIETIFRDNKSIQVLTTFTVLTDNFASELREKYLPHVLVVFDDVATKGTTLENVVRDVLDTVPETRIVFCISDANREESMRDALLFLYNYEIYNTILISKPLDRNALIDVILHPCTAKEMEARFPKYLSEVIEDNTPQPIETPLSDEEIDSFYSKVYGATMSSFDFEGSQTRENYNYLYDEYINESNPFNTAQKICPSCGQLYMSSQNFCSDCGSQLISFASPSSDPVNEKTEENENISNNVTDMAEGTQTKPNEDTPSLPYYCPNCKTHYMFGTICNTCGSELVGTEAAPIAIVENDVSSNTTTLEEINLPVVLPSAPLDIIETDEIEESNFEMLPPITNQVVTLSQESISSDSFNLFVVHIETEYDNYVAEILGSVTICVYKLEKAVGCTHITVELAQTLKHSKYDCAVVFSDNETYEGFASYLEFDINNPSFKYDGITYYKPMGLYRAKGNHKVVVADMGLFQSFTDKVFEESQIKVVVADAGLWNIGIFENFIKNNDPIINQIHYCVNFIGNKRFSAKIFPMFKNKEMSISRISESESPLQPCNENSAYYRQILSMLMEKKTKKRKRG